MEPLFDRPYDELRKAFVRARFAEPAVFGCEDIEAWLETYKPGQPIEGAEPWQCPLFVSTVDAECRSRDMALGAFLADAATPVDRVPNDLFDGVSRLIASNVTRSMGKRLYCARSPHQLMILGGHYQVYTMTCVASGSVMIRPTTSTDVLWVLREEIVHARPQATVALGFMKEHLARVIDRERESAQRDFDEAVAVSADGTEIVKAKWVVVFSREPEWRNRGYIFPGTAFHGIKCRRTSMFGATADIGFKEDSLFHNESLRTLDDLFGWVVGLPTMESHWSSYFLREKQDAFQGALGSLLAIDESFCPSPLPDGGREIRV